MPPQVNARLVAVNGADAATGGADDWDSPASPGAPAGSLKWDGGADAYYRETERRLEDGGNTTVVAVRELYVDTTVARAASIDTDDVITFLDPAGVERTGRALIVTRSELAGIPEALQTTRLELEPR
jgi:hypothetical protein